jgi:hypothetical protein
VDTIILAAGLNERLNGVVPTGHKPLIVHGGLPLVAHAARQGLAAREPHEGDRVIVVASPDNAGVLHQVLNPKVHMIVQRFPHGPGDALLTGLRLCGAGEVLILLGDNVTSDADVAAVRDTPGNVVSVGTIPIDECERFTRWREATDIWVEKVPVDQKLDLWGNSDSGPKALVWLGPLKFRANDIRRVLLLYRDGLRDSKVFHDELPIGPTFNALPDIERVGVTSVDLGVPEVLP